MIWKVIRDNMGGLYVLEDKSWPNQICRVLTNNYATAQLIASAPKQHEFIRKLIGSGVLSPRYNKELYDEGILIVSEAGGK